MANWPQHRTPLKSGAGLDCTTVGDVMMDVILRSRRSIFDSLNFEGTNYFREFRITPGGSGNLSAAVACLGGEAGLVGRAGKDPFGKAYDDDLVSLGVRSEISLDPKQPTGLAVCLVDGRGRRTMFVSRGANDNLTAQEVLEGLRRLGPSRFTCLSGYSLAFPGHKKTLLRAATNAQDHGSLVVFDPGAANLVRAQSTVFASIVNECDLLCANIEETRALARGGQVLPYSRLLSRKGKLVLVKMGPQGCLLVEEGMAKKLPGVRSRAVDTTGAGDAFLGALLYCLSRGYSTSISASFANWFASRLIEDLGPRSFPARPEINSSLAMFSGKSNSVYSLRTRT